MVDSAPDSTRRIPWPNLLGAWVATRVLVGIAFALTHTAWFDRLNTPLSQEANGLTLWDGSWYTQISAHGYDGLEPAALRFFPLYPMAGRVVSWVAFSPAEVGLAIVANVASLLAMWLLYRVLVVNEFPASTVRLAVWWLALFSASAVMVFDYSESLALCLSLACVLLVQKHRFGFAAVVGLAFGLSRPTAALLCIVLVALVWPVVRDPERAWGQRVAAALAAMSVPAGTAIYLSWLQVVHGDWTIPIDYQREYRGTFVDPLSRVVRGTVDALRGNFTDGFNVGFALVVLVSIVAAARLVPWHWTAYSAVNWVVITSADNINSLGRYAIGVFPTAAALAIAHRWLVDRVVVSGTDGQVADDGVAGRALIAVPLAASAGLMVIYCLWAISGRMIP